MTNKQKHFILDTNVLLHNPDSIYAFQENTVVIPITVVEELDSFKRKSDKMGMHARQVLRELDSSIQQGALKTGAKLKSGGLLKIALGPAKEKIPNVDPTLADNKILAVTWELQKKGFPVIFISKDVNARIKGEALGISSQDYENQKVEYESIYKGWRELFLSPKEITRFSKNHRISPNGHELFANECTWIKSNENPKTSLIGRYDIEEKHVYQIKGEQECMGIRPLNLEQRFAFDLLINENIQLVSLIGHAGTGKTLLALACGLEQVIGTTPRYEKLLVARPIVPLGKDIGYLPGTKDQKLNYWMQPIFDNLNYILTTEEQQPKTIKRTFKSQDKADYLIDSGIVEIEAITYIRGRSIPNQFIIIDEAQNLTPHEIKTIISRAGEGTKIVLTGDPEQIDNPYLDSNSNGLSFTAERMKEQSISGHVFLSKSERSELASVAAEIL
jgi:PhoH-like ATPase